MPRTITFQPSKELAEFIEMLMKTGSYNNQSEVIRAGLRLLQEQTVASKLQQLKTLIEEGENSGEPMDWDMEQFLSRMEQTKDDA